MFMSHKSKVLHHPTRMEGAATHAVAIPALCLVLFLMNQATAGTVLHYEFEEGPPNQQANLVLDSGPNGITGTALQVGTATRPIYRDLLSTGLQLDFFGNGTASPSSASYVEVIDPGVSPLDLTGPLTVEAIIRPAEIRQQAIVRKKGGLAGSGYWLSMHDDGHVSLRMQDDLTGAYGSSVLQPDTTYHVAGTWDGTTIRIYVNHQIDGTFAYNGALIANDDKLGIGAILRNTGTVGQGFAGLIDSVRISDQALSPSEILGVPEPSSLLLATLGVLSLVGAGRRRAKDRLPHARGNLT